MKTNIAEFFEESSVLYSDRLAIVSQVEKGRKVTFRQLKDMTNAYACEFHRAGIAKGTKVLMMLQPGTDFIAAVFAVFKIGAIPVLIDPGMGLKNLLDCIRKTSPEAMIGISKAHWIKYFFPFFFSTIKISIVHGAFAPPWITKLEMLLKKNNKNRNFKCEETKLDDTAAIVFTTGSTGPPKGVVYTHGIYIAQLDIIRQTYGAGPSETDLPAFPLFALFSIAVGMPVVIPEMDPSRPANVNPEKIIEAVTKNNVTFSFGSPALWRKVSAYCIEKNMRLPSLKKVLMAGAPINSDVHEMVKRIISPDGETLVPYGATEALPIANFAGTEMLAETAEKTAAGAGYCIGRPIDGMTIKIIDAVKGPIEKWSPALELRQGSKGEIMVKGPVVTPCYFNEPEHTRNAKIADTDGKVWHRMGDIGYYDEKGRLWFCGRKAHRVMTETRILYSVCCEAIFNRHPDVSRSALVGIGPEGRQTPVIIIEPKSGKMPGSEDEKMKFIDELNDLGADHDFTLRISQFLFHPAFPVDIRHNAKIFREKLADWAKDKSIKS
jgi:acyl-CoA synthetase (AMP-forming)/AMP-acid ligase II